MPACTTHPNVETAKTCAGCNQPYCDQCLVPFEKLFLCGTCKQRFLGAESPVAEAPASSTTAKQRPVARSRKRAPRRPGGWIPWAVGIGAILFVLLFAFFVINRLASPMLEDRRAERLSDALDELATLGAAIEQYHAENGEFPEKLSDLVPEFVDAVPDDPYRKATPVYERHDDRVLLYSVGPDKKDDKGQPFDRKRRRGDLLYPVSLP